MRGADLPEDYGSLPIEVRERIRTAQYRALRMVSGEVIGLYRDTGKIILDRQESEGWGAKVIDRLSHDLKLAFPDMTRFSPRNLKYMRTFSRSWPDREFMQRIIAQTPWRSNIALLAKLKDPGLRTWYAQKTIEYGWSREILVIQVENRLRRSRGCWRMGNGGWWVDWTERATGTDMRSFQELGI